MANQRISTGFVFPVYIDETGNADRIAPGVFADETSGSSNVTFNLVAATATAAKASLTPAVTKTAGAASATGADAALLPKITFILGAVAGTAVAEPVTPIAGTFVNLVKAAAAGAAEPFTFSISSTVALRMAAAIAHAAAVAPTGGSSGIDTHDGAWRKRHKKLAQAEARLIAKDVVRNARNRERIVQSFERIVEGKPELPDDFLEMVENHVFEEISTRSEAPRIDAEQILSNLETVDRLWHEYLERDDEEVLMLL